MWVYLAEDFFARRTHENCTPTIHQLLSKLPSRIQRLPSLRTAYDFRASLNRPRRTISASRHSVGKCIPRSAENVRVNRGRRVQWSRKLHADTKTQKGHSNKWAVDPGTSKSSTVCKIAAYQSSVWWARYTRRWLYWNIRKLSDDSFLRKQTVRWSVLANGGEDDECIGYIQRFGKWLDTRKSSQGRRQIRTFQTNSWFVIHRVAVKSCQL